MSRDGLNDVEHPETSDSAAKSLTRTLLLVKYQHFVRLVLGTNHILRWLNSTIYEFGIPGLIVITIRMNQSGGDNGPVERFGEDTWLVRNGWCQVRHTWISKPPLTRWEGSAPDHPSTHH